MMCVTWSSNSYNFHSSCTKVSFSCEIFSTSWADVGTDIIHNSIILLTQQPSLYNTHPHNRSKICKFLFA